MTSITSSNPNEQEKRNKVLLEELVLALDRTSTPDENWPDENGIYWSLCPFHPNVSDLPFSVNTNGFECQECQKKGTLIDLALSPEINIIPLNNPGITLSEYANITNLPRSFLENLGLAERKKNGVPAVIIPYYDKKKNEVATRIRLRWHGDIIYKWMSSRKKFIPYGFWRLEVLQRCSVSGGGKQEIILVDNETDCQLLWFYGINALGIPDAYAGDNNWVKSLSIFDVYIWQSPGRAGEEFIDLVGELLPDTKILSPLKNQSSLIECHRQDLDIKSLIGNMILNSVPMQDRINQQNQERVDKAEKEAANLLSSQDILKEFVNLIKELGLTGEISNAKLIFLALNSRFFDSPINITIKGPSSSGKSFLAEVVKKLFPDSSYYALTGMSERALVYSDENFAHRYIMIFENNGINSDVLNYIIRSLISEKHLKYLTVEKTQDGLKSREINKPGPTGFITTTTLEKLHPENETRILSLHSRDDRQQTHDIIMVLANSVENNQNSTPDLSPWHAFQEWLELAGNRNVRIPYATYIAQYSSTYAVRMRRDFNTVLIFIKVHAFIHQKHRSTDSDGYVLATVEDYEAIYNLVIDLISEGLEISVKPIIRETVEAVQNLLGPNNSTVTYKKLCSYLRLDKSTISRRVNAAIQKGYLINEEEKKGHPATIILGDPLPKDESALPHPDDLKKYLSLTPSQGTATVQQSDQTLIPDEEIITCTFCGSANWEVYPDGSGCYCVSCNQ